MNVEPESEFGKQASKQLLRLSDRIVADHPAASLLNVVTAPQRGMRTGHLHGRNPVFDPRREAQNLVMPFRHQGTDRNNC